MSEFTDEELLKQYLHEGKEDAFSELYIRFNNLKGVIYRIVMESSMVEELYHDSWMLALTSIGRFNWECRLRTWFWRIVVNHTISYVRIRSRKAKSKLKYGLVWDTVKPDTLSSLNSLHALTDDLKLVNEAVSQLPTRLRLTIQAYYYKELGEGAVGIELSIPKPTVRTRLFRARQQIKQSLIEMGIGE